MMTRDNRQWGRRWALGTVALALACLAGCSKGPSVSIQSLIDAADSGATIDVPAGTYRENLSIAKTLTLVGLTDGDDAVEIVGTEANTPAIAIDGDRDTTVELRSIAVTRSYGAGIDVTGDATATLRSISVDDTVASGLNARSGAQVHATDCTFSSSHRNGATVSGDAQLTAEQCDFLSNAAAGLGIVTTRSVLLEACDVRDNGENGITVGGATDATFRSVLLEDNGGGEPTSADFVTLATAIMSQADAGLWMRDDAVVLLENCSIRTSAATGIIAFDDASITIRGGEVSDNGEVGLQLLSDGTHTLEDVDIRGNGGMGILLARDPLVHVDRCTIAENNFGGVAVFATACYGLDAAQSYYLFTGRIDGSDNVIPGPNEPDGNLEFDCCPSTRCRLLTRSTEESTDANADDP